MTRHVAGASQRRAKSGPLANVVAVLMAGGARHPFLAAEHAPPPQAIPHGARPQAALCAGSRASPPPGGLAGPPQRIKAAIMALTNAAGVSIRKE